MWEKLPVIDVFVMTPIISKQSVANLQLSVKIHKQPHLNYSNSYCCDFMPENYKAMHSLSMFASVVFLNELNSLTQLCTNVQIDATYSKNLFYILTLKGNIILQMELEKQYIKDYY